MKSLLIGICALAMVASLNAFGQAKIAFDVYDHGAKCDGSTNDTSAIQGAINGATAGMVHLPNATCVVSTIRMKSNVYLFSHGATLKLVASAGAAPSTNVVHFNGVDNSGILGHLRIDGNRANQTNVGDNGAMCVRISGAAKDIYLQSIFATGCPGDGLYIGLTGDVPKGIYINRFIADQSYRNGGSITNGENITIDYFEGRTTTGSKGPQAGFDIETNVAGNTLRNIYIRHLLTSGNEGHGTQILGVLDGTSFVHGDVTIDRLDSYSNGLSGVLMYAVRNITINDGHIYRNTNAGIEIPRHVKHLRLKAHIHSNGLHGVNGALSSQRVASSDWNFSESVIRSNSQNRPNLADGIRLDSDSASFTLTRVRGHNLKLYDDQGSMTQRYGFTTGTNVSSVDFRGHIPANGTGNYVLSSSNSYAEIGRISATVTVDPGSIGANAALDVDITVIGVLIGDRVETAAPSAPGFETNVLITGAWVHADHTVRVRLYNPTGRAIDPAARSWKFVLTRH
jgi:hypothetical protein